MTIETWPNSPRIQDAFDRLSQIPEGREIVALLKTHNIELSIDNNYARSATTSVNMSIKDARYRYGKMSIVFGNLPDGNLIQALVHEAQHLRQHLCGLVNPTAIVDEEQIKLLHRFLEADAQTIATDIAFKLKQLGDETPWIAAQQVGYSDMCNAYEHAYRQDNSSINNGRAMAAAFNAWFGSDERLKHYDSDTETVHIPFLQRLLKTNTAHGLQGGHLKSAWYKAIGNIGKRPFNYLDQTGAAVKSPSYTRLIPHADKI